MLTMLHSISDFKESPARKKKRHSKKINYHNYTVNNFHQLFTLSSTFIITTLDSYVQQATLELDLPTDD